MGVFPVSCCLIQANSVSEAGTHPFAGSAGQQAVREPSIFASLELVLQVHPAFYSGAGDLNSILYSCMKPPSKSFPKFLFTQF